jgi:hypothetical protein
VAAAPEAPAPPHQVAVANSAPTPAPAPATPPQSTSPPAPFPKPFAPFPIAEEEVPRGLPLILGLAAGALVLMVATSLTTLWLSGYFEPPAPSAFASATETPTDNRSKEVLAQQNLQTVLDAWKAGGTLEAYQRPSSEIWFAETAVRARLRDYKINAIKRDKDERDAYDIAVTLTLPAGPENRLYEVRFYEKQCVIRVKRQEDVNGTIDHARALLSAYLDVWRDDAFFKRFQEAHPEVGDVADVRFTPVRVKGERLLRYEITSAKVDDFGLGYRFGVTLMTELDGKEGERRVSFHIYKDYHVENGLWNIHGAK